MKIEDIAMVYQLTKLGLGPHVIRGLARIGATLNHLDLRVCNGEGWGPREDEWTEADSKHATNRIKSLMRKAQELCNVSEYGCGHDLYRRLIAYHQAAATGDPRGCSLYVVKEWELNGRPMESCYRSAGVAVR